MNTQTEKGKKWLALVCGCVVWGCGCYTRKPQARPVVNFLATVRPVIPAETSAELEAPPDVPTEVPEPPQIELSRVQPTRPHVTPAPAPGPSAEKTVEPTIAPELTTAEMTAAKTQTQVALDTAEKNLAMAQGRRLNAAQQDLASKIRGFSENAREAMRTGDWVKAKNLARKAQVLSEQLAESL